MTFSGKENTYFLMDTTHVNDRDFERQMIGILNATIAARPTPSRARDFRQQELISILAESPDNRFAPRAAGDAGQRREHLL